MPHSKVPLPLLHLSLPSSCVKNKNKTTVSCDSGYHPIQSSPTQSSPFQPRVDCKNCVWILFHKTGQSQNEKYDTDSSLNNNNKMVLSTLERLDLLPQHTDDLDRYDTANAQSQMIHKQVWKIETVNDQWKSQTVNSQRGIRWQMLSHRWFTNRYSMKQQMLHDHVTDNSWRGMRWQMLSHRWFTNKYKRLEQ